MEIIPAIDIIDGKCVRLQKGDFDQQIVYHDDPLEVARSFEEEGIRRLHLVDLDGAKEGKMRNFSILEDIANGTELVIDYGGGVQSVEDAKRIFDAGADFVTIGSIAMTKPDVFADITSICGPDAVLVGADVLEEMIHIKGWQVNTGVHIFELLKRLQEMGISNVFCTDISRDGMMEGCSHEFYEKVIAAFPGFQLIASGGVTSLSDLDKLKKVGCSGAIIGKALYEGAITFEELKYAQYI